MQPNTNWIFQLYQASKKIPVEEYQNFQDFIAQISEDKKIEAIEESVNKLESRICDLYTNVYINVDEYTQDIRAQCKFLYEYRSLLNDQQKIQIDHYIKRAGCVISPRNYTALLNDFSITK